MRKGQRGQRPARPPRARDGGQTNNTEQPNRPGRPARTGDGPRGADRRPTDRAEGRSRAGPAGARPARDGASPARPSRERPPLRRSADRDSKRKSGPGAAGLFEDQPRKHFKRRSNSPSRFPSRDVEGGGAPAAEMRIAKAMARAGLCSRRDAERWITEGRVKVNGQTLTSPARDVGPTDRVLVDDKPLPDTSDIRLWRYHKPKGLVTTHRDPEGRPTVFEKLPPELPRVISVGRLDVGSEGLLLLTNSGELARHMELPSTGWLRRYRVRAWGNVTQADLDALKAGRNVDGVQYGPIEATLDSQKGDNVWITVGLREGKNREVRKVLGSLGLQVNRLIRVSFGPFQLLDLAPGAVETVRRRVLADQLGIDLARQFGLTAEADERREQEAVRSQRRTAKPKPVEPEP